MKQEIFSRNNKYVAVWDSNHNNGYWIFLVQGTEDDKNAYDTDYQIGFFERKTEQFYLDATIKDTQINLLELAELCMMCNYQKPTLRMNEPVFK